MFVKKIIFIFILISANLLLAQQNSKPISDRYIKENIAVFEIKDASSGYGKDLGKKLTSLIENSLTRMNRFNIVDRKNLDKYLKDNEILDLRAGFYQKAYKLELPHTKVEFFKNGKKSTHYSKYYRGLLLRNIAINGEITSPFQLISSRTSGIARILEYEVL